MPSSQASCASLRTKQEMEQEAAAMVCNLVEEEVKTAGTAEKDLLPEEVTMEDVEDGDNGKVLDEGQGNMEEEKLARATELLYVGVGQEPKHEEELQTVLLDGENQARTLQLSSGF